MMKGLVTHVSPQSKSALLASRKELAKLNVKYNLFPISGIKSKQFGVKLWRDFTCLISLLFHNYDFLLINPGVAYMRRNTLLKCLLFIAGIKKIPVYVRWGNCKFIFKKIKKRMGIKKYESAIKLMHSSIISHHLTLNPFSARDLASETGISRSLIIHNCNELPKQYLKPKIPVDPPIIINVGSVQYRKGPDLFVEIAKIVCGEHPEAKFVWIGGHANNKITQLIKELGLEQRVQFIGKVTPPYEWMHKASLTMFTSRSDAFPLVCVEVMACYRTVVCFSGSGQEFIVGDSGVIISQFDCKAAAEQILRIIKQPASERINYGAYERYNSMFSPAPYAKRLADILHSPETAINKYQYTVKT